MTDKTTALGEREKSSLTEAECRAMRILKEDGWTHAQLAAVFECGEGTITRHLSGCKVHCL